MTDLAAPEANLFDIGEWLLQAAIHVLPFGTASRLHWTGLGAFLILGACIYMFDRARLRGEGYDSLVSFLVPRRIYTSNSTRVDVKLFFANQLFAPLVKLVSTGVAMVIVIVVAGWVGGSIQPDTEGTLSPLMLVIAALSTAIAGDFAVYWTHRLHHENALLWPFHKVHHSAEHLNPLTLFRKHPVYNFLSGLAGAALKAPVMGIVLGLFGLYDVATLLGIGIVYFAFNFAGANLRHSHIWLDFGPVLDRIFISPAQHQIHHSQAPRHHDKNYGEVFAVWDWLFGTLYVPQEREDLTFGVADEFGNPLPQVHDTLVGAYIAPFREFAIAWKARRPNADEDAQGKAAAL